MESLVSVTDKTVVVRQANELPGRLNALVQERLSLPEILKRANWFVLWVQPLAGVTPYAFAGLEESDHEVYGYCLWARRNGRVQKMAYTLSKAALSICLEEKNCDLTAEPQTVQQFLQAISRQLMQRV